MSKLPTLCLDFDSTIHSYASGWRGATTISDPPVPGAIAFIVEASAQFTVAIFSSRSADQGGIVAMQDWLWRHMLIDLDRATATDVFQRIEWPFFKPPAFLSIDDRSIRFTGRWPAMETLRNFRTWQQPDATPDWEREYAILYRDHESLKSELAKLHDDLNRLASLAKRATGRKE